jgi:Uma2 family endonuclease
LGWLIDPQTPLVEIYRSQQDVEVLSFSFDNPPQLLGEEILPGFILDLTIILNP